MPKLHLQRSIYSRIQFAVCKLLTSAPVEYPESKSTSSTSLIESSFESDGVCLKWSQQIHSGGHAFQAEGNQFKLAMRAGAV